LILMAPDETTRALIDMYARTDVQLVPGPIDADSIAHLRVLLDGEPAALVAAQLPGREDGRMARSLSLGRDGAEARARDQAAAWITAARLRILHRYALPNGRRYVLLEALR
jgi:hypothetical protein